MEENPEVSVVVPISERHDDIKQLYKLYADELKKVGKEFEILFILDGNFPIAYDDLLKLKDSGNPIRIIKLAKNFEKSYGKHPNNY